MRGNSDPPDESSGDTTPREGVSPGPNEIPTDPTWGPDPQRTWSQGERTPAPPTAGETARLLAAVGPLEAESTVACVRVLLERGDDTVRDQLLEQLRSERTVVGTSVDRPCGPQGEAAFEALLTPEHDPFGVVSALASVDVVAGVAMAKYPRPLTDADERADAEPSGEREPATDRAAGDAPGTDATEEPAEDVSATDATEEPAGDRAPEDRRSEEPVDGPVREEGLAEEVVEAPESVFEELRSEVDPVEYDDLVDELEAADVGTADGTETDLDPLLGNGEADDADSKVDGADEEDSTDGSTASTVSGGAEATETDDDLDPADDLDPDAVLSALVTALDDRSLGERELTTFRDALGISAPESLRARLDHLQGQVEELLAYRQSLEGFIDETDGGDRVADLEADVESLSDAVDDLDGRTDDLQSDVESVTGVLADFDERLAELESDVDALAETADELDERLQHLDDRAADRSSLDGLEGRMADVRADLDAVESWRDRLTAALVPDEDVNAADRPADAEGD